MTPDDLDALIGEIEHEAARRQAEPGYPHARDLAVRRQLDDLSPGGGVKPNELIRAVLLAVGDRGGAPADHRRAWPPTAPAVTAALQTLSERIDELASATATALGLLFDRDAPPVVPGADPLAGWAPVLHRPPHSPVIVAGPPGDGLAASLVLAGETPSAVGSLVAEPGAAVVIVRPTSGDLGDGLVDRLVAAGSVELVSPAPWWWRIDRTVMPGPPGPPTSAAAPSPEPASASAPASAEAWLEALHAAGFTATARYDAEGRSYHVAAHR